MKQLLKISNADLSYRLNLNYNNVYSRLKMLLGKKASLFADISTKSSGTTWYSDDDAEYSRLSEAPKEDVNNLSVALNDAVSAVRKELSVAPELANYVDDILEIPDNSFVFYRKDGASYKFILAGWGCKYAHQSTNDPNSGFIKRISKNLEMPETPPETPQKKDISQLLAGIHNDEPQKEPLKPEIKNDPEEPSKKPEIQSEPTMGLTNSEINVKPKEHEKEPEPLVKKTQHVSVRVIDQNSNPVDGEVVQINSSNGLATKVTSEKGLVDVGNLPYGESFGVSFPNLTGNQERTFEVEHGVETYDAFIKKLVKYTPLLFIEDQNGNAVQDYNVKVVIKGQDTVYNSGMDGVIQLPTMQEGQKFVVIDTANYANTEEYNITQAEAKTPYHFHIKTAEKTKVGITVLDKAGKPIPKASVNLQIGDTPCHQQTGEDGRAEFPYDVFVEGVIPVTLNIKGKGKIKSNLQFTPDITEYTIQLQDKTGGRGRFDWKWLSLIPLLLLFGWGGNEVYKLLSKKTPTIAEMESGVVMTISQTSYFVDLNVKDIKYGGKPLKGFYFTYNPNEGSIENGTFDIDERVWGVSTGTGFLISKDGLIATNRHIADPIPPEEVSKLLKQYYQAYKDTCQKYIDQYDDLLKIWAGIRKLDDDYLKVREKLQYYQSQKNIFDKILNTGDFKVQVSCKVSVAFTGTRVEDVEDLGVTAQKGLGLESFGFYKCSTLQKGEPGTVKENDVAIIQLNSKAKDIPENAFIFEVPEKDPLDEDIPDDYEITVLGYNAGMGLQDMKLQEGIKPQAQHGKISNTSEKYRIGYSAQIIGGSSGSPVLNKEHNLIAVNNSGVSITQGFNYGVRTKYLKELLDNIRKKNKD